MFPVRYGLNLYIYIYHSDENYANILVDAWHIKALLTVVSNCYFCKRCEEVMTEAISEIMERN
jgi:hypothetical protein